ncbi:S-adenosyl-L-methionine-dependent methyltransferase [Dichotomocladium elegans]|nr:S-adenosyl-L-methionine-dependent methyltransferase [Dichotomocladium elegans]
MFSQSNGKQTNTVCLETQITSGDDFQKSNGSYLYRNGRPYHNRGDVAYILPADNKEKDRVHKQHSLFRGLSGSNHSAPVTEALEKGIKVHDAGCGPGTWSLEMANEYPNSTFYGTDILTRFPETIRPGNCHFKTLNLVVPGNFPENYFDYVHQRLLVGALPANSWGKVIEEHVRTLAPGGWLEVVEPQLFHTLRNAPPKLRELITAFAATLSSKGLHPKIDEEIEEMFRQAGLINIKVTTFNLPTGETTQLGNMSWKDISQGFKSIIPHGADLYPDLQCEEKQDQFLEEVREECMEHQPLWLICRVFGQKPPPY